MRQNSKSKGDIGELKAATYFTELGYFVSRPLTDNAPYDIIIDNHTQLLKVQVKTRTSNKGRVDLFLYSISNKIKTYYTKNNIDLIFIYVLDLKIACLLNWNDIEKIRNKHGIILRTQIPKNNQLSLIHMFKDYQIDL